MAEQMTGGCACGRVRYTATVEPNELEDYLGPARFKTAPSSVTRHIRIWSNERRIQVRLYQKSLGVLS